MGGFFPKMNEKYGDVDREVQLVGLLLQCLRLAEHGIIRRICQGAASSPLSLALFFFFFFFFPLFSHKSRI